MIFTKNKNFITHTIIGMLICTVIFYLFLLLGTNLLLTAAFFVIPVAGALFGGIIGVCAKLGMAKDDSSCGEGRQAIFALVLVLFLFFLTVLDYKTCFISNGEVSRLFAGEHISKVEGYNFGEYFSKVYINSELNLSLYGANLGSTGDTGFSFIIYVLHYIGIIAVGLVTLSSGGVKVLKCKKCGKVIRNKVLKKYYEDIDPVMTLDSYSPDLSNWETLQGEDLGVKDFSCKYQVMGEYCPDCKCGALKMYRRTYSGGKLKFDLLHIKEI